MSLKKFVSNVNVATVLAAHLVGKQHTHVHRRIFGLIIMFTGIGIIHGASVFSIGIIHYIGETIGAGVHGIGLLPFLEKIEDKIEDEIKG